MTATFSLLRFLQPHYARKSNDPFVRLELLLLDSP